jgi:NAD(P)-dependent dehydrogenase (short-subunit alcohol dehydrogenase family)
MRDKVCVITGANRGLGRATALALARAGASVVMLCRDGLRCEWARDEVARLSGSAHVSTVTCDLASLASVRAAAAEITRRYPTGVHVLVNNAGVNRTRRAVSADGFEMTLAVNHLGPFLLTNLLLPTLRAGALARVVTVTSRFERLGRVHFDDLQLEQGYGALRAYAQSKLANILFTYELAARLAGTGVTANCAHPGLVATDLMREWPRWMRRLWTPFLRTPDEAARTIAWLASAPGLEGVTGRYFEPGRRGGARPREARSSRRSYDAEARRRLWRVTEALTGLGGA